MRSLQFLTVYVTIQLHRRLSVAKRINPKLPAHCFGPFQIIVSVGEANYKLLLPETARADPVLDISQLKMAIRNHPTETELSCGLEVDNIDPAEPEAILAI